MEPPAPTNGPDPRLFHLPGLVVLGCFLLYGPAEAMLHVAPPAAAPLALYLLFTALLFAVWGLGLLRMKRGLAPERALALLSAALLALSVPLYLGALDLALGNTAGRGNPLLVTVPNPAPDLLTVGPELRVATYHAVIFGGFFPLLYWALAVPLLGAPGMGRAGLLLRLFAAWLGWGALGLTYQDWFYFVAHPTHSLVPGGRYGVYFTHWLGPLPTVYLLSHLWGFGWLWLAWRGSPAARGLARVAMLVGGMAAAGVALTLLKPVWAG